MHALFVMKWHSRVTQFVFHCCLHLFRNIPQPNIFNELVPGQSVGDGLYGSESLHWPCIKHQPHLPHFCSDKSFFCLLPLFFTEAILDEESAWKKQITLPHTGLLYQCSMSTVLPVEYINVCVTVFTIHCMAHVHHCHMCEHDGIYDMKYLNNLSNKYTQTQTMQTTY